METSDIADVIENAADVLRTQGHTKGKLSNYNGQVCAWGALYQAACGTVDDAHMRREGFVLAKEAGQQIIFMKRETVQLPAYADLNAVRGGYYDLRLATWNDRDERTPEEVVELFLGVAKRLRNEAQP